MSADSAILSGADAAESIGSGIQDASVSDDPAILNGADAGESSVRLDLPVGWQQAVKVELTQEAVGLAAAGARPDVTISPGAGFVSVQAMGVMGRCDQQMAGWVRYSGGQLDLLFQPNDMHPSTVGKCATAYKLTATVPAASGSITVVISQRSDAYAYAGAPSLNEIARGSVSVP